MNIDDILNPGERERKKLDTQLGVLDSLIENHSPAATRLPVHANGPVEGASLTGAVGLQPRQTLPKSNSELAYERWIGSADPAARAVSLMLDLCLDRAIAETAIQYVYISAYMTGMEAANARIAEKISESMRAGFDGRANPHSNDSAAAARDREFARTVARAQP